MGAYIVDRAEHKKAVDGRNGPMQVISLWLRDGDNQAPTEAEWFTRAQTPIPQPGTTIEGNLTVGEYGWKFTKAKTAGPGGQRGDLSPEAQARIDATGRAQGRAHAQEMALRYAAIKAHLGAIAPDFKPSTLVPIIDFFYEDAQAAKDKAA